MSARMELALGAVLLLNLVDLVATITWVGAGLAHEANPLLAPLLVWSPALFAAVKLALVSASVLALASAERAAPRLAFAASVACVAIYSVLAAYHAAGGAL